MRPLGVGQVLRRECGRAVRSQVRGHSSYVPPCPSFILASLGDSLPFVEARRATHVALLRGINVGGKNRLPMKDLSAIFRAAGCSRVETYIQSGNVIFQAPERSASRIPSLVAVAIQERLGLSVPVVTRTAAELQQTVGNNPLLRAGADPETLHVAFLAEQPAAARVAALDLRRSPPDEFVVSGREVYIRCPKGIGGSKLTNAYFDSKLATISTLRNWRTVLKLLEMTTERLA